MSQDINNKIIELLHRRLQHQLLNDEEARELENWIDESPENKELYSGLLNKQLFDAAIKEFGEPDTEASLRKVKQRIYANEERDHVHIRTTSQTPWRKTVLRVAAAIIPFLLIGGGYLYFRSTPQSEAAEKKPDQTVFANQIPPGGDHAGDYARLTLSNGSTISMDHKQIGALAIKESAIKYGEMLYDFAKANAAGKVMLNTLTIPRGFLIKKIELPDKTNVWLSAVSTIRFPDKFSDTERRVEVEGEAYFEVAKDASKPFIVSITTEKGKQQGSEIKVLGTHFFVTAYNNEEVITTTLLEGSVQVTSNKESIKIKPGQQAVLTTNKSIKIIDQIDTVAYAAHRDGIFRFRKAPVTMIMNQVERMYHVKVVSDGTLPDEFSTTLDQRTSLENLLKVFNESDELACSIDESGSTITVKSKAK